MFIVRSVHENDLDSLYELAKLITLINLPSDRDELKRKITASVESFINPSKKLEENFYIFVLEDIENNAIIGASMVHGKHGTPAEPHFYLKVGREHKLSTSINTGFIHGTLKFGMEDDGYTEIGGLILNPEYRGHPKKLGKILSFSRFLYIAKNPTQFTKSIHSELLPPFDNEGNSPLWEAIGRKFLNMNYHDADKLSRENKEFITSLYPVDTIYETLLPIQARDAIGKVGKTTEPVKKMLESVGFRYVEEVDPFDGGPHYRALKKEILPIKNSRTYTIKFKSKLKEKSTFMATIKHDQYSFYSFIFDGDDQNDTILVAEKDRDKFLNNTSLFAFPL
jgi:arginine N-succinyltransferase